MNVEELSINGIEKLEKMIGFKNEANRLFKLVAENQKIGLFPDGYGRYVVWEDAYNVEYLVENEGEWKWVAHYLHQHYEVPISAAGIFEMIKNGYEWSIDEANKGRTNNCKDAIGYFKAYVDGKLCKKTK